MMTKNKKMIVGFRSSSGHLKGKASASIIFSDDNGKTWSEEVIIDNGLDFKDSKYGIRNVNVTFLKNKSIIATYHENDGDYGSLYFKTSSDNGTTWSNRKQILFENFETNKISCEGHLIEVDNRFVIPVFEGNKNDSLNAGVVISEDLSSWKYVKLPNQNGNEHENTLIKDNDQNLIMFYSDPTTEKLYRSISKDKGNSWSIPQDITFTEWKVHHRPTVYYDSSTEHMFIIFREKTEQSGALAISYDKGVTWQRILTVNDDKRRITYGDFIKISKNKIGLVFASEQKSNGHNSNLYFAELIRTKK
ncbi:sialidase family protein [Snuella lapsa]|uniref:Sialidase domain-containing protein n=1 Tax=Snuella lapsa TaxID=870481 RepID=A0ABP6XGH6_9FLAO